MRPLIKKSCLDLTVSSTRRDGRLPIRLTDFLESNCSSCGIHVLLFAFALYSTSGFDCESEFICLQLRIRLTY